MKTSWDVGGWLGWVEVGCAVFCNRHLGRFRCVDARNGQRCSRVVGSCSGGGCCGKCHGLMWYGIDVKPIQVPFPLDTN